ncbi:MAG: glycine zipper domain-containing protein [Alphaproteobacteria bacterium]|nr:glycine zipper domain-containing protein [Alphaproteobacteria bacterium]
MKLFGWMAVAAAATGMAACTATGNTERGALGGAALGAAAGAIIGNNTGSGDAGTGAAIGAAVGAAGGAYAGNQKDRTQTASGQYQRGPNGEQLVFDRQANRYYYVDRQSGRTYWANGEFRG